jgi:UDP-N-acetylmuramate--alanine ligase
MHNFSLINDYKNYYFIGIGGINMSALAEALWRDGYKVYGSDKADSSAVEHLRSLGIAVNVGTHNASNLPEDAEVVVYNAAISVQNPELALAEERGLVLLDRAGLLGLLMKNFKYAVCVAGTHGKTSTTSMLAEIFMAAGLDPTVMSGGVLPSMGGAMRLSCSLAKGNRDFFIAEACEYHNSFLKFYPYIGIILNIEMDHGDFYKSEAELRESFRSFSAKIPKDGLLIINAEIPDYQDITQGLSCKVLTFGSGGDIFAQDVVFGADGGSEFTAKRRTAEDGCSYRLAVPGRHNISNALAAILAASHFGLKDKKIAEALRGFKGAQRRFQRLGQYNGADIIDDYAHHPTEVAATLTAAKKILEGSEGRLWVVFQPHTHNRTEEFLSEFAKSLSIADKPLILDIYRPAGREEEKSAVHSKDLVDAINNPNKLYLESFDTAVDYARKNLISGDMLITMGAGDVYLAGNRIVAQ